MLSINQSIQSTKKDDLVFHGKPSGAYFSKLEKVRKPTFIKENYSPQKNPGKIEGINILLMQYLQK